MQDIPASAFYVVAPDTAERFSRVLGMLSNLGV
jgi:hypothetical protein